MTPYILKPFHLIFLFNIVIIQGAAEITPLFDIRHRAADRDKVEL